MKGSKIKEHVCPDCNGTGYPVVKQPVQPGHRIYPVKCTSCDGKGKVTDQVKYLEAIRRLVELGLRVKK
jgi:DnaJ-class molecular chaperone